MAQYFEVLSQGDGNSDQTNQFFNGNQENETTRVRYILAGDNSQFQTQQVMVLEGSQQQIQGVVIDQGHTYQTTNQPQQFGTVVQNANINSPSTPQIFYMESNSQGGDSIQAVQTVIDQASIQTTQVAAHPQPIVLNHQVGSNSQTVTSRQVLQGAPGQRSILQIRTPPRPHVQVNQQPRPPNNPMRPGLPQQVRPHQSTPLPMRALISQQAQMRPRTTVPQVRQTTQQQTQNARPPLMSQVQQAKTHLMSLGRQMIALQQQKQSQQQQAPTAAQLIRQQLPQQVVQQQQTASPVLGTSIQKSINEFHHRQLQQQEQGSSAIQHQAISIGKQIIKPLSEFRPFLVKDEVEELDDHDPAMNSSPSQMVNYKKLLEHKQQIGKNPILARLSTNIKVSSASNNQQQPNQSLQQICSNYSESIDQVVHQVTQQQQQSPQQPTLPSPTQTSQTADGNAAAGLRINLNPPSPQKKPRAPPRSRNPNAPPRSAARPKLPRLPVAQPPYTSPRPAATPQQSADPRFPINHQQQRFANQQQMAQQQQRAQLQQQQHSPHPSLATLQPPVQRNGISATGPGQPQVNSAQSQMNYLITPPTPNRPRQQHPLPAFIPSSQIQQIIGMFQESTPVAEEFSDSIRMLVLLENGEQRLITFTLPKEACTIQEILEQVNVPFTPETNIQVTEANTNGINYIVTVGQVSNFGYSNNEEEQPEPTELEPNPQDLSPQTEPPRPPSPEQPRLIPGKLAVCSYCGYTGEDFNKCRRCNRKIPDNAKSVEVLAGDSPNPKSTQAEKIKPLLSSSINNPHLNSPMKLGDSPINTSLSNSSSPAKSEPATKAPGSVKKKVTRSKPVEHESVVISSDEEEEDEKKPLKSVSEQLLNKLGASISISPVTKEPSLAEVKKHVRKVIAESAKYVKLPLKCRTVRIGSYRFVPGEDVIIDSKCILIKAPVLEGNSETKTIRIYKGDIVKVLICFSKTIPVIFYYLNEAVGPVIRQLLNLNKESGLYFDPLDEKEDSYRKITLLPDDILDEHKTIFQQLYGTPPCNIIDELTSKEANDILIKACPKDSAASNMGSFSEIKQILMYPKEGQGRLSINTEDYVCLAVDQFLNDKIIDFYLKYLWESLPPGQQEKVHIFSTFFYKRLTTKPTKAAKKSHPFETDPTLNAAEKRHARVRNWTKKINIFEKDFIVVPINENAHWFLAIICFPGLRGPHTFDGNPYVTEPKPKKTKNKSTPESKKEKVIPCDDPLLSDKDEADSEDSDMESDGSEEAASAAAAAIAAAAAAPPPPPVVTHSKGKNSSRTPIKQPCILIFDSLAGPRRSRVVATLRDYLTIEFKMKMDSERVFNRDVIKGSNCKVPQQNNFTDCGLYLLQYVEQFFKEPITDYNIPIRGITNWFEEIIVTKKREDICNLLKKLMTESGVDTSILPDIALPTLDGKLVERPETERDHETGEEEQEDMFTDIEDSEMADLSSLSSSRGREENGPSKGDECQDNSSGGENSSQGSFHSSPIKPSDNSIGDSSDIVSTAEESGSLKPTLREVSTRQASNKDTLMYLKSKRIAPRHKPSSEGPDYKKTKIDNY